MPNHPYAQPIGALDQIINHLRTSPLKDISASRLKSLGIAPNNESYIVNTLRALGLFDTEGKAVDATIDVFYKDDSEFPKAFEPIVKSTYQGLFDLHGDTAWQLEKARLTSFFRTQDRSSALVGGRQADTFIKLAEIAGKRPVRPQSNSGNPTTPRPKQQQAKQQSKQAKNTSPTTGLEPNTAVALTVRVEVNLPGDASKETYDDIFASIKNHLM